MAIIFDGKKYANEKELDLKLRVKSLKSKPKIVSVLIGTNKASLLYTKLKSQAGKRVGIKFVIKKFPTKTDPKKIIAFIERLGKDKTVHGIMVQLPLPSELKKWKVKIIAAIDPKKDVDGLTKKSLFLPATVKAVIAIVDCATKPLAYSGKKAAVVGAKGTVGSAVVKELQKKGYKVTECDETTRDLYAKLTGADLVVSATGVAGLIKGEVIKEGVIAIDVGSPKAEMDKGVAERASFVTPVPGGVGPVTIVCLLENLIEAVETQN